MSTPRPETSVDLSHINHPNNPQWITDGLGVVLQVPEGYDAAGKPLDQRARNIARLSMQIANERAVHEGANRWKLEVATDGVVSRDELRQTYRNLAGKPQEIGAYVLWIGKVTTAAYDHLHHVRVADQAHYTHMTRSVNGEANFTDIVLDIGGIRQAGYWEGTKGLDAWAASIGGRLVAREPRADVQRCTTPKDQVRGYKLYRQFATVKRHTAPGVDPVQDELSATVRRRRREAIIRIPGLRQLLVVKESTGWLHVDEIGSPGIRNTIANRLSDWDEEVDGVENSPVAMEAGKIFERAIAQRSSGNEITPLSAHYYVIGSTTMSKVEA